MSATRIALTPKAWETLTLPSVKDFCSHCGQLAYVWDGKVACVDRSGPNGYGRYCPGNGQPPRRSS